MKKIILLITGILFVMGVNAQRTLESCYQKARENYPIIKQLSLIERARELNLATVSKNWIPQISLTGRVSWQSDVTALPDRFLSILEQMGVTDVAFPGKDQYNFALNLNQVIWDGGAMATQKKMAVSQAEINKEQVEVSLYNIYYQVNQLFFNILLLDMQQELNQLFIEELEKDSRTIESYMANGVAQQTDLDNIRVAILDAQQKNIEMKSLQKAALLVLSAFIGEEVKNAIELQLPEENNPKNTGVRPEITLFNAQIKQLDIQHKMLYTKGMPRIALFATGALGNPGLNMFKSGFTPYFMGGVNLLWNFGGLYTRNNDVQNISTMQKTIEVQKETFLFNTKQKTTQQNAEIEKFRTLLEQDDEIIVLRSKIKKSSEEKVKNGTLSVSDFLRDTTMELIAKQTKLLHEIQLLQAVSQLQLETGIDHNK